LHLEANGMAETGMARVAIFSTAGHAEVEPEYLPIVSPYTWYCGPGNVPMTVIGTPEGRRSIRMTALIDASNPELELSPEDFGLPPGTELRPPVPWLPGPGLVLVSLNERGEPVIGILSNSPPPSVATLATERAAATADLITEVLGDQ